MNVDDLIRDSFREQNAQSAPPPVDLADRVLAVRRRRRTRTIASVAVATAAAVAVAVAVPRLDSGKNDVRPANVLDHGDLIAHPDQSPPRDMIAAGRVVLAAYCTATSVRQSGGRHTTVRTYWLLNPRTHTYEKATKWSFVAIAPGLRTAAVLERELPTSRIGLLDLLTGKVERWIPVEHTVGAVAFSPDGRTLLATTYKKNPDVHVTLSGNQSSRWPNYQEPGRTGFSIVDVASGTESWSKVPSGDGTGLNDRQDFGFSRDGKLVYTGLTAEPGQQFYDFRGHPAPTPALEKHLRWYVDARLSPNGRLAAGDAGGGTKYSSSEILNPTTGSRTTTVRGQQLLAWIDNERLIAWDITPGSNEFRNRLVVVALGSDKEVPLSGFRGGDDRAAGRWTPVFAAR
ncbi:WD40 repeat domain-containing protein [Streptomyces sp. NPDC005132]|uniref:WD40 repeat domain-containing protein n=1 Tax=Streptomyces sp. NPDC005132 TaxID=3154294 RepID=UPI0033B2B464